MHGFVGQSRRRIDGAEDEIVLLRLGIPPAVPGRPESFPLGSELPKLRRRLGGKPADQRRPLLIPSDVPNPKVVEIT